MIGVVKFYDPRCGIGLLSPDGGGADVAVFISELKRAGIPSLFAGQRLAFSIRTDRMRQRCYAIGLELHKSSSEK